MVWLAGALLSCNGCRLELPERRNGLPSNPDASRTDSGTTSSGDSADSGPPALCEWQELEPNGLAEPQALPMETQACGLFDEDIDQDWFRFTPPRPGWVWLMLDAAALGSAANVSMAVSRADDDESAFVLDGPLTTDAQLRFPSATPSELLVGVIEQTGSSGPDHFWYLMATEAKPPVTWDAEELEPNEDAEAAMPMDVDAMFGTIGATRGGLADEDWYLLSMGPDATTLTVDVDAFEFGSALDAVVDIWDANGAHLHSDRHGAGGAGDRDPYLDLRLDGAPTPVYLRVSEEGAAAGGAFHWYVLHVDLE